MDRIIEYFCKNSFVVNLISIFILLAGLAAFYSVPRALLPPMKFNVVEVSAYLPGASALEIQEHVALRLEEGLQNITGLKSISTKSSKNIASLSLTFLTEYDVELCLEKVNAALQGLRNELPRDLRELNAAIRSKESEFLAVISVAGFDADNIKHQDWLEEYSRKIQLLPAIVSVENSMAQNYISIEFKARALQDYALDLVNIRSQIIQALDYNPIGEIRTSYESLQIKIGDNQDHVNLLKELPIKVTGEGSQVRLEDLAEVSVKSFPYSSLTFQNGIATTILLLQKNLNSDSIESINSVKGFIKHQNSLLPENIKVALQEDGSVFIKRQLNTLKENAIFGVILIIVLLSLFVGFRVAMVATFGLPITFSIVMIVLWWLGMSINLVSVVAMLLVVGVLVDDAIIVSEKFADLLQAGYDRYQAAFVATKQMIVPVTGTLLTTIVAFLPILLIPSELSVVMAAIPVVVITSLIASWFETFFLLPNHLHHFVKKLPSRRTRYVYKLAQSYAYCLTYVLKGRYLVLFLFLSLMIGSVLLIRKLEFSDNLNVNSASV